ncbi:MAG: SDR family NAD(P)-dependent oxidoreductase [Methylococcaceae bacterium]
MANAKGPAFVYSGNGCQWAGMGKRLLEQSTTFRRIVTEVDSLFSHYADFSLVYELAGLNGTDRYEHTEIAQPALFALQVGITGILREHGVQPCAVTGHSVGEVAAAWACGALSLAEAVKVIFYRSHHQGKTKGSGQMTAVGLSEQDITPLLELSRFDELHLAGINSYRGVTIAGSAVQLSALELELEARNVFFKRLNLDYAFHSPEMDAIEADLCADLAQLETRQPSVPYFSTVTGAMCDDALNAEYWWHNVRRPVLFQQAINAILNTGINIFIEIGAHPVLKSYLNDSFKDTDTKGLIIPTVLRDKDNLAQLMDSVAQTIISGADYDRKHWFPVAGEFIRLPNYPWQREKCWHPVTSESHGLLTRKLVHPLLGYPLPQHELIWENQLDTQLYPYLADHKVGGAVVFPGAGFIELALAAAYQTHPSDTLEIEELEIRSPLLLSHDQCKVIRFSLEAANGQLSLCSRELAGSSEWSHHLVGRVLSEATGRMLDVAAPDIPERLPDFDNVSHAQLTELVGLDYGPAFQAISHGWTDNSSALGIITIPESISAQMDQYYLHPALLDCAFQLVFQILKEDIVNHEGLAFVPIKIGKIYLRTNKAVPYTFKATLLHRSPHSLNAEFVLYDAEGKALAVINDVRFRAVRLQRPHAQHLHYLDYHLTAAPLGIKSVPDGHLIASALHDAIKCARSVNESTGHRYSEEVEPLLDSLCNQFILEALRAIVDGSGLLPDSYVAGSDKTRPKASLLRAFIAIAVDNHLLNIVEVGWQLNPSGLLQDISATAIWNTLVQEYPDYFYLIHLAGRVGMHLVKLLSDEIHAEDLGITPELYANINSYILEHTGKQILSDVFVEQCQKIIANLPAGERLSILEISTHKPEFAALLCSHLDLNQSDYCFAGLCDDALNTAEGLRDNFPLLQTRRINTASDTTEQLEARANFAIISLNRANIQEIQSLLAQLPSLLMPGSPVFLIGQHPAGWIDVVLGSSQKWWVMAEDQPFLSPQISANLAAELLKDLNYKNIQTTEFIPDSCSGPYLLSTCINTQSTASVSAARNWLILAGDCEPEQSLAEQITKRLAAEGHNVSRHEKRWHTSALDPYDHIIHLSGFGQADVAEQTERCWIAGELIQTLEATSTNVTLWLLTQNVGSLFPCDQKNCNTGFLANDAALWGFGRTLMNEASNYHVRLVDISADMDHADDALFTALTNELLYGDKEQEIVLNSTGQRFAPRLRTRDSLIAADSDPHSANDQTLRLGFKLPGQLRNLQWQAVPRLAPADDEIEVEIKATGLNFRDIMYTLGLLSDEAVENGFVGPTLGLEFAGVVTRIGTHVSTFKPGDPVVGLGPASFSNRVLTKANALAAIPDKIGYAAAATIPSTFFTVYYALHYQARLQPGEKILIHGAAGGVGIAAIQIARWLGAEIYATVGSDEKRDFLRLMGIKHIHDSRSLSFAEEILLKTEHRGVDVVLNSLAGEAINRNFQVLKPFGRFLELGKRDFYENTHIGLRPFRNNISYFGIDADQLMQERPELTRQLFSDMMQLFHEGILHPLPYTTFDANQVIDAFRYMQQAKQIGKIVVTYDHGVYAKPVSKSRQKISLNLSANASYLITGGLGGFGLRTAQWLVEKGARYLILISRSGATSAEAKAALAHFAKQGVTVYAAACDVTDKAALGSLLTHCDITMPPLKGIVHAAAVIDDGLARNFNCDQIKRVLEPKILGAKYLHELTLDKALDLFVLYSSVTTLFGNPGQSNYVAANLWLEALASSRRQQGLPATCVRWGAIDDVGFLARNEKIKEALQNRMGGSALTSAIALNVLEQIILSTSQILGVMEFDWHALSNFLPTAQSPKFRELAIFAPNTDNHDDHRADLKRLLGELSHEELKAAFIDLLKEELSQILLIAKEKIDPNHSMYDMGLDSLMGVELMIAIESRFDVQIPVMALSEAPTLSKLADRLIVQLRGEIQTPSSTADTLANINDLSRRHDSEVTQEQISALTRELESDSPGKKIIH